MNIPTIEELTPIAVQARRDAPTGMGLAAEITAIRDAVVAACRPQFRPIEEMPAEVPKGCVRMYGGHYHKDNQWIVSGTLYSLDTHFIDIAIPSPSYPADFEQAFAESGLDAKDKDAVFKLWKGGAR